MPRKFDFISPGIELNEIDQSTLPPASNEDGPIIIGRTVKGPALKPVKIRSLEDYIAVFGRPNPGGSSPTGDLWRDGAGSAAPTYASYAAQAWLAGGTSPVTMVRLLGEDHTAASTNSQKAGWKLDNSKNAAYASNSTAYGLFIIDKTATGQGTKSELLFGSDNGVVATYDTQTLTIKRAGSTKVVFTFDNTDTAKNGTAEFITGTSIKLHTRGLTTTQFITLVETGFALASTQGLLSDFSIDNSGGDGLSTSNGITIHNLSTAENLQILASASQQFLLGGFNLSVQRTINAATAAEGEGALAAVLYANSGALKLKGPLATTGGGGSTVSGSCTLVESVNADVGFQLVTVGTDGLDDETIPFNFNRNSGNYIRKVLNTNPTLTNSRITAAGNLKTYWLGESFERYLKDKVTSSTAGDQYAMLLPLESGSVNWADRKQGYQAANSGFVIANYEGAAGNFDVATQPKMFKVIAIQEGYRIQKEVYISFENLTLPANPEVYGYSTFDLVVRSVSSDAVLERFSELVMDENSTNFVARRIGDMFSQWDEEKKRYRMYGDYPNQSDYVRIEMAPTLPDSQAALPFGFLGPGRPKGFGVLKGDTQAKSFDLSSDFAGAFAENGDAGDDISHTGDFVHQALTDMSIKFSFPSIQLRKNGTQGFPASPYRAMFGIRPKISDSSNIYDVDYCDYVRGLPALARSNETNPTGDYEHSILFSLDDLVIDTSTNVVTYTSGSHKGGTAFRSSTNSTANQNGSVETLLNLGVRQWAMPLFGGYDGLDITELEPFSNSLTQNSDTNLSSYIVNSYNIAVDSVADEELVPANLILAPGFKDAHLTNKLISTAEARQDVLAIVDLDGDYIPKVEAPLTTNINRRGTVNDAVSNLKSRNIDSSFACAFYPSVQITDRLGGSELVWIPASVAALGAMARSDSLADVWFAPAGFNRGGLGSLGGPSGPTVVQARQRLDSKDRDDLYSVGINPIASFPNEGLVVFGQKTLQQRASALDRINVRRLMLYVKRKVGNVAKNTLFQNNVPATWADFKSKAEPILADVKSRFGLTDYLLILDETTTTPDLIDRNILYAKVFLKPARAIEFIAIDFVITKTGAEFA